MKPIDQYKKARLEVIKHAFLAERKKFPEDAVLHLDKGFHNEVFNVRLSQICKTLCGQMHIPTQDPQTALYTCLSWVGKALKPPFGVNQMTWSELLSALKNPEASKTTRQYYFKNTHCLAPNLDHPACICWYDENTGPLANSQMVLVWRIKP